MVDNRGVAPISSFNFKAGDASGMANKMSEEKNGQGGEYFAQEMYEENQEEQTNQYQDRSAQLRASLDSLAMVNAGSMMVKKLIKEKERLKNQGQENLKSKKNKDKQEKQQESEEESV